MNYFSVKMSEYPFLDRIRIALNEKNKKLTWLSSEIEKSERWFYNITDFQKLEIGVVDKISTLLDKNFMQDYNAWRLQHEQPAMHILGEPGMNHQVEVKRTHIQLRLSAPANVAEENMSKMLMAIRREGEKLGFDIE